MATNLTDSLIDRLVAGDLSEAERKPLLIEIAASENGWRDLALAFLEAQCWRESFATISAPSKNFKARKYLRGSAIAASVALAFGIGRALPYSQPPRLVETTKTRTLAPETPVLRESTPQAVAWDKLDSFQEQTQTLTEDDLQQFRKLGYEVGLRERIVEMQEQGGRLVAVPVREVEVRYVNRPTL